MLTPSPKEQQSARYGGYQTFDDMPRIVREWAKSIGCKETQLGVFAEMEPGEDNRTFTDLARWCLKHS